MALLNGARSVSSRKELWYVVAVTIHDHVPPAREPPLCAFMVAVAASVAVGPARLLDLPRYLRPLPRGLFLLGKRGAFPNARPTVRASAPDRDLVWTCRPEDAFRLVSVSAA